MFSKLNDQSGSVLLVVLTLLLMATMIGVSMFSISDDDLTISSNAKNTTKAFYSAEAGLAVARAKLWGDYLAWGSTNPYKVAGQPGSRETYQKFLDNLGLNDNTTLLIVSGTDLGEGQYVSSVDAQRTDAADATLLTLTSKGGSADKTEHTIRSQIRIEGEAFKGFEYAILANNINCIMCHATIDNVERVFNTDTLKDNTFDRVKVASLESMQIRTNMANSFIAGSLYTRGDITDGNGNVLSDLSPTGKGIEGYELSADGKILEPMNNVDLVNATGDPLPAYGNLYMDYPTDSDKMTDGDLPSEFPPPFPDLNGNRQIDDNEYDEIADNTNGGVSGGIIYTLNGNQKYSSTDLPSSGNTNSLSQNYDGNLILVGTKSDPIEINGDIAIDGDVIIQGYVKGTGQIYARGNVYVTGNLQYADGSVNGNRTFGTAADNTQNALSVAAGNNVLVGDYLTPGWGDVNDVNNIDPGNLVNDERMSFTQIEMTLFNRSEWTKTQPTLPDKNGNPVVNKTYEPDHKPRYYTMNEKDPVYIFNKSTTQSSWWGGTTVRGTYWDPSTNTWAGDEETTYYDLDKLSRFEAGNVALDGAEVVSLSAENSWISPSTLKELWMDDESQRADGEALKIDGQLYTNNSIFTITRKNSKSKGKMEINGAIVASDLGVLASEGLKLNYDQRMKNFLKIKDESKVTLNQVAWFSE